MTKEQYACIEQAKEDMRKIKVLAEGYSWYGSCGNRCDTQEDINKIRSIASKWLHDFEDTKCNWRADNG